MLRRLLFSSAALGLALSWPSLARQAEANGIIGTRALSQSEHGQNQPLATVSKAEISDSGEVASLTFALSAGVDVAALVLSDPDRVIVDLPALAFDLDPQIGKPAKPGRRQAAQTAHLIGSYRFGSFAPGRSRIVLDLTGPARVTRSEVVQDPATGRYQLVLQLTKTDRASFRAAAQAARLKMAAEPNRDMGAKPVSPTSALPRILIDPGHGGVDSGAMVGSLVEKNVVLEFAKALAAKLRETGRYDVVMTRQDDSFVTLGDRVKMARAEDAALFVSIHADTLAEGDVSGATVYTVSDKASDAQAARVADKENQADSAAGVEKNEEASGVNDILFDLTRRETRAYSHVFAHTLANYWRVAARLNKNPERSAGFKVLTAPDVPSVLLELGYLSNEKDAQSLNSPEWRDQATNQVMASIESFFAARSATAEPTKATSTEAGGSSDATTLVSQMKAVSLSDVTATTH